MDPRLTSSAVESRGDDEFFGGPAKKTELGKQNRIPERRVAASGWFEKKRVGL